VILDGRGEVAVGGLAGDSYCLIDGDGRLGGKVEEVLGRWRLGVGNVFHKSGLFRYFLLSDFYNFLEGKVEAGQKSCGELWAEAEAGFVGNDFAFGEENVTLAFEGEKISIQKVLAGLTQRAKASVQQILSFVEMGYHKREISRNIFSTVQATAGELWSTFEEIFERTLYYKLIDFNESKKS
jgi:hypothetical protein